MKESKSTSLPHESASQTTTSSTATTSNNMKVFITGASGYIGTAVLKELISQGQTVIGLSRSQTGVDKIKANGGTPLLGNVADIDLMVKTAADADATIHLAFDHSFTDMAKASQEEVAFINAIGKAYEGTDKILVATSGTLAGAGIPDFNEDTIVPPRPHSWRQATENALNDWSKRGVRTALVRVPQVYGPDINPYAFLLQQIGAHRRAGYAAIFGENHWTSVHVEDVARLYALAVTLPGTGHILHGVGEHIKPADIARLTAAKYGLEIKELPADKAREHHGFIGPFIPIDNTTSIEKTRKLGWTPKEEGFIDGLREGKYWDDVVLDAHF